PCALRSSPRSVSHRDLHSFPTRRSSDLSLHVLVDGQVRRTREIVARAADLLQLSETDRAVLIPSGQEQWKNRGNWALSYLARAGAVERPSRGRYVITEVGRELLE